ncbi:hypothetical protein WJX84_008583 [Apatococcus fuscideae]|uniref:Enkurin domain-containing protein n=1 Tax=Apatococcus fuscideae TaxID=2026836 RepID=A0AAW1S649_9CHLO
MGHGHGTGQKSQRRSERPGRQQLSSGVRLQGSHPWEASREAGRSQTSSSGESQPAASPWMSENGTCHASSQHPAQTEMATGTLIPAKVSSGNPWGSLHSSYVPSSATTSAAQQDARNRQEWRIKAQNPAGSAGLHEEAQGVLKGRPYATEHSAQALGATAGCLEGKLLKLNQERAALDSEYAKLPVTAGRTILQRRRKAEVEDRLSRIQLESSAIRLRLKAMDIK